MWPIRLGVIVVAAAGNGGSDPYTINSPADAPLAIAAGAMNNDRFFADGVVLPDNSSLVAVPGNGTYPSASITGSLTDVFSVDGNGLACSSLPAGSLTGTIALIFRGTCTFESKIDNAQAAGAAAVVVYDNIDGEAIPLMAVGTATVPAVMISNADGLTLKPQAVNGFAVTVQFVPGAFYTNPAGIASFSARGPNIDFSIKPDVLAVGVNVYTAAEKLDPNGEVFSSDGYAIAAGTSFAAPLVAGAAAIVKQARPGLTADQYRSLLVNSAAPAWLAPGTTASVQQGGAGVLDVLAALNSTVAAAPVSLSFGAGGSTVGATQSLTLTNVGTVSDTFQIAVSPAGSSGPAPQLSHYQRATGPRCFGDSAGGVPGRFPDARRVRRLCQCAGTAVECRGACTLLVWRPVGCAGAHYGAFQHGFRSGRFAYRECDSVPDYGRYRTAGKRHDALGHGGNAGRQGRRDCVCRLVDSERPGRHRATRPAGWHEHVPDPGGQFSGHRHDCRAVVTLRAAASRYNVTLGVVPAR